MKNVCEKLHLKPFQALCWFLDTHHLSAHSFLTYELETLR